MKIRTQLCNGEKALEEFLNDEIDYDCRKIETVILGITQNNDYYTVIYKDYNDE